MTADALARERSWLPVPTRPGRAFGRTDASDPGRVAANARLALAADLASKASLFVVLAIVAHVLSTAEFAALGVALAAITVLTTILDAGASIVLVRDGRGQPGLALSMLRASAVARVPLVLVACCGGLAVGARIGHPVESALVVASAVTAAATLSLVALFRAVEMFAVEVVQKLWGAALGVLGVVVLVAASPTAAAALAGLCLGTAVTLPALLRRAGTVGGDAPPFAGPSPLRVSAPFGLIAVATILYYRVPTLVLGAGGSSADTASYVLASTIALGLLAFPNAITSALLPRLARLSDQSRQVAVARRSLVWSVQLWALLAIGIATVARPLLAVSFGTRYADAAAPLAILLLAGLLISASGAIGTMLAAVRHTGILVVQVILSLAVNLTFAAALIPRWGATGAATATLVTEVASLALIGAAAWGRIDGLVRRPSVRGLACASAAALLAAEGTITGGVMGIACGAGAALFVIAADPQLASRLRPYPVSALREPAGLPSAVLGTLAGTAVLAAWAAATNYGMRVISDTPTYLALVPRLAARPLEPLSPFLDTGGVADSHATPYLQLLAWVWNSVEARHDASGHPVLDPTELGRFLGLVGIVVMLIVLHSVFVFARREAGARAAWVTLPVLLLLFGPAHVIWAGDLTFHGFMYGAYFPQTLAIGLLLATVLVTELEPGVPRYVVGSACAAATLLVHPLTGLLLAVLIAIRGSTLAYGRDPAWRVGPICLVSGCVVGLAWPGYSVANALGQAGTNGPLLIALCAAAPAVVRMLPESATTSPTICGTHSRPWTARRRECGSPFSGRRSPRCSPRGSPCCSRGRTRTPSSTRITSASTGSRIAGAGRSCSRRAPSDSRAWSGSRCAGGRSRSCGSRAVSQSESQASSASRCRSGGASFFSVRSRSRLASPSSWSRRHPAPCAGSSCRPSPSWRCSRSRRSLRSHRRSRTSTRRCRTSTSSRGSCRIARGWSRRTPSRVTSSRP